MYFIGDPKLGTLFRTRVREQICHRRGGMPEQSGLEEMASIPATWREWLLLNQERGCDREGMMERAMARASSVRP